MNDKADFTQGSILKKLIAFMEKEWKWYVPSTMEST